MRILVTGSDGYLGALLTPRLMRAGHDVVGVDTGFFRSAWLYEPAEPAPPTITADHRSLTARELQGFEAIVHMGDLSNDPLGQLAPDVTYAINHRGAVRLAAAARDAGVRRFVFMSSCSVYGVATGGDVDERTPPNPQTAYATCKALVERDVGALACESFSPTFLRNATAFGASPRMRFDLVLNNLAGLAWTQRRIAMTSDGTPWRPLVHGADIARAIEIVLTSDVGAVHNQVFNVGASCQNYQVRDIARIVADAFPGCEISFGRGPDNRSYRVSFEKICEHLPAFSCQHDARSGALELRTVFERIAMTAEVFNAASYTRLAQLQALRDSGQLDGDLLWRAA